MVKTITVVTTTYKKYEYIFNSINSVLIQNYPMIELIISDDCGGNEFPQNEITDFIENNKSSNLINYIVRQNEKNLGTVRHLNYLYKISQGEIIVNLSGDDTFYNDSVLTNISMQFDNTNVNLVVTSRLVYDQNSTPLYFLPHICERKKIRKLSTASSQYAAFVTDTFRDMASGSALAIRKSYFDINGYYDEKYYLWEDGPFFTKYTLKNAITFTYDIVSIKYRLGGVSTVINPLLHADYLLYCDTDRIANLNKLTTFERKMVQYTCDKKKSKNRLILRFKYPLVSLYLLFYSIQRRMYKFIDIILVKCLDIVKN